MKSKLLLITGIVLFASQSIFAQGTAAVTKYGLPEKKDFSRFSIGLYGGISLFHGDVREKYSAANSKENFKAQPCFGIQGGFQITHTLGLQMKFGATKFHQAPSDSIYVPGFNKRYLLDFESPVTEGQLNFTYTMGNISFLKGKNRVHFVLNTGVGLMTHETTLKDRSNNNEVIYSTKKVTEITVPFGLGVKYQIGPVDLGLLFDYNKMFTDNVDGIEAGYAYDGYSHLSLAVNYIFGKKQKMEWVNPMELVFNDINGWKLDKDSDGVSDYFDKDNNTPNGTKVYGDGTSVDTDKDGVPDFMDADPYSVPGAKVDASGKELDADGDGVGDTNDKESNTKPGSLVNFQGVTIPRDTANNISSLDNNGGIGFLPSVFFDFNKSKINNVYYGRMLMIARVMKLNPDLKFTIIGSTDQVGNIEYNKKLGIARANAAKAHLIAVYGIDPARLSVTTVGKNEPFAKPVKSYDYLNRRVDFKVDNPSGNGFK